VPRHAIVVGAGVAGASTTWHLARSGLKVTLVERAAPAAGASGRNPGFLWLQTKAPGPQMEFALAGRRYMEELAAELGDFGFRACGGLILIRDERLAAAGAAFAADRATAGLATELLDRADVRALVPDIGAEVVAGVWNPLDAHQDTRRLVHLLVQAALDHGADVKCGTGAASLDVHAGRCDGVRLEDGTSLPADLTVLCCGIDANRLLAPHDLDLPLVPVRYEALETAPSQTRIGPVLCGQSLFGHFDFIRDLVAASGALPAAPDPLIPSLGFTEQIAQYADGRFQLGCAVTAGTLDDRPTLAGLGLAGTVLARNLPALAALPVERIWAGIVAQAPDYMPFITSRHGLDGLALNTGHAFGNLAGALSGRIVADLVAEQTPPVPGEWFVVRRATD
jgi:glycine/D-amino acid oxidase-like deaminating enzyme